MLGHRDTQLENKMRNDTGTRELLQEQLRHIGETRGRAGQQNIKGSKLFSDCFVYCASGFGLGGAVIPSSLPWAARAIKAFVLDWCLGKSD